VTAGRGKREVGSVPPGVTLVELLVVLVLLGLIFGISGVALASLSRPQVSVRLGQLGAAHARAIRTGQPVSVGPDTLPASRFPSPVLFLPDGRALGPGVDPLTGAPVATR